MNLTQHLNCTAVVVNLYIMIDAHPYLILAVFCVSGDTFARPIAAVVHVNEPTNGAKTIVGFLFYLTVPRIASRNL